ncbi:MAG: hypothetical protein ABIH23_30980 [bacterium]
MRQTATCQACAICFYVATVLFWIPQMSRASDDIDATSSLESFQAQLSSRFQDWKEHALNGDYDPTDSGLPGYYANPHSEELVAFGPRALPFLFDAIKENEEHVRACIVPAIRRIIKKYFSLDVMKRYSPVGSYAMYIDWWEKEWRKTADEFALAYTKWKEAKEGDEKEAAYQELLDLGVAALPYAMEKIAGGDKQLFEAVNYWTNAELLSLESKQRLIVRNRENLYLRWWKENKEKWLIPSH